MARMMEAVLVGLGMVAKAHVRAISELNIRLAGVHCRDRARREAFADEAADILGYRPWPMEGLDEIVAARPAFVILATPPSARLEYAEALAAARTPVLMEKPVERSLAGAERVVETFERAGIPMGVVFQHRARDEVGFLRARMVEGEMGELQMVEARVPWWREQAYYDQPGRGSYAHDGGGVLLTQAIHTLDLMLSLVPPVTEVTAMLATTGLHRMEAEDMAVAGLRFEGGVPGMVTATTAAYPGGGESITLHFDHAVARLEPGRLVIDWRDGKRDELGAEEAAPSGGGADPMAFTHAWHRAVIYDFAVAIWEGTAPMVTGREALEVHRLIDAMERSSREGRRVLLAAEGAAA